MAIQFLCSNCNTRLQVPDDRGGSKVRCPGCKNVMQAPLSEAPALPEVVGDEPDTGVIEPRLVPREREEAPADKPSRPRRSRRRERTIYCPECDRENSEDDRRCYSCGANLRPRRERETPDATGGLIPYKNGFALASYYLGVFSLIPCLGIALGIVAVVMGIMGLNYAGKHPTAKGQAHAWVGIILGGLIFLAHLAVIIILIVGYF